MRLDGHARVRSTRRIAARMLAQRVARLEAIVEAQDRALTAATRELAALRGGEPGASGTASAAPITSH